MKIVPLDNWLIIKPRPPVDTVGNLVLPNNPSEKDAVFPIVGDVLEAGPGKRTEDGAVLIMRIKKGNVVLLNGLTARRLTLGIGEEVIMLREHEVAAVVENMPPVSLLKLMPKEEN